MYIKSWCSCSLRPLTSTTGILNNLIYFTFTIYNPKPQTHKHYYKMYISPSFVFLSLLALLATDILAVTLYRGDTRGPKTIKDAGGFKSKGSEGTVFEHVEGTLKHPSKDRFISTSSDINAAKEKAGNGYLYTLDSTKISKPIHNVAAEYEAAHKTYGHADEKEFAVEEEIPWDAITQVQKKDGGVFKTLKMPTKRASEFPAEDVFAA